MINKVIHQPVRLRIMASLVTLGLEEQMNFVDLRDLLVLTDGNLGAHLQKLEESEYVELEKTYVARKPCTYVSITLKGRAAFEEHVKFLKKIIGE